MIDFVVDGAVSSGNVPMGVDIFTGTNSTNRLSRININSFGYIGMGIVGNSPNLLTLYSAATTTPLLAIGNGAATTTVAGGVAGSVTSTFKGDVSIANAYLGTQTLSDDLVLADLYNQPISSSVASSTIVGITLGPDNMAAFGVFGSSDGAGSVNKPQVGIGRIGTSAPTSTLTITSDYGAWLTIGNAAGTASTTLTAVSTSTFAGGVAATRFFQTDTGTGFADYIFENPENVMSFADLQKYIAEYKHLPGIQSAEEVQNNGGFSPGDLAKGLLEELEKLYVYVIRLADETTHSVQMLFSWNRDQDAKINQMLYEIAELKMEIKQLKDSK